MKFTLPLLATVFLVFLSGNFAALHSQDIQGEKLWQRTFDPVTRGDQEGPNNNRKFSVGYGSHNLATFGGEYLAFVGEDLEEPRDSYYVTTLKAGSGETLHSLAIRSDIGNSRSYRFPWAIVSASGDNIPGLLRIRWDPQTGILFSSQGAYESSYTAYRPLSEEAENGEPAPPAYAEMLENHPGVMDAFGRKPAELWTALGIPAKRTEGMDPDAWGLAVFYWGEDTEAKMPYDNDWEQIWGKQGSSHYNTPGKFSLQEKGPLIGIAKGADWGHNQAGHFYLFNKHTGLKVMNEKPEMPKNAAGIELRVFQSGGLMLGENRIFLIGPGEDRNKDNQLGARRPEGLIPNMDQGLAIWAYDYTLSDEQPNDGLEGPAALDTIRLELAFAHDMPSTYETADGAPFGELGQSWYETDGFYRPKPMVIDGEGKGVWVSWKPSQADGVQLVYADEEGTRKIDLGIGHGMKGVDLWPKLELAETSAGRRLVYATPASFYREKLNIDDVDEYMAPLGVGVGPKVIPYPELPEQEKEKIRNEIKRAGAWSKELMGVRGEAALAVADPDSGEVLWTDNLSERFMYLDANGFWTYIDRSHMTVIGERAVFAFVNNGLGQSTLELAFYDLKHAGPEAPEPEVRNIPLGFDGTEFNGSCLTSLHYDPASGTLYALVTQGRVFNLRDPRWQAQHIVAIK